MQYKQRVGHTAAEPDFASDPSEEGEGLFQIGRKLPRQGGPLCAFPLAEDEGGMDRNKADQVRCEGKGLAAISLDGHRLAEHGPRSAGAKRHDDFRPNDRDLLLQPPFADIDFSTGRLLVQSPLPSLHELEMFDRVRDVDGFTRKAGL